MHHLNCHASSHVCALCHVIDCPSLFVVCLLLLDRRRRWDRRSYEFTSEVLAQHQAVEQAGKYSLTWTIVPFPHLLPILSIVYLLALWFDACVSIPSHVILKPWYSLTSTPIALLFVGLCRSSMLRFVCARVLLSFTFSPVYYDSWVSI